MNAARKSLGTLRRGFGKIDLMVRMIVVAIVLASVVPATGEARDGAQLVSNAAIFVLFLLNGLRIPRGEVVRALGRRRFLLPLCAWCFIAMALVGKGLEQLTSNWLPPLVALGFIYLGALPSTVQSATAYSSLAGGRVSSSVMSAAITNILGVFISVPIIAALGGGALESMGAEALTKVVCILILPFAIGQMLQTRLANWIVGHRDLTTWMDRISIAIAVYVAMSGAVEQGLWRTIGGVEWAILMAGVSAFLAFGFIGAGATARTLGLDRQDRIAFLFAGAHKSVAMGAPLAAVIFPPQVAGIVILPLLAYHLMQLIVSAPIANRLAMPGDSG